jgi:predicted dehydrogenase
MANRKPAKKNSKPAKSASTKKPKQQQQKIRYAVVGLGYFAQVAVLPAFKHAKNSELVALVSGDEKKLKTLSKKYKVENTYSYEQYDELLESGLIDAVYIVLPNHLHKEYAERAARLGIHVLCEKPLAATSDDARQILETFENSQAKLMTAYRLHFQKANMEAVRIAHSGEIGEPRAFNSMFAFQIKEPNIRLNDESLGGGPMHDIGIYCINAARYIFREEPYEVFAVASGGRDDRFKEVDEMHSVIMRFSDGKVASFTSSYAASAIAYYEVLGTKGSVCLDNAYEFVGEMEMEVSFDSGKSRTKKFPKSDQVAPEIEYFSKCIINDETPEPRGYEGYLDLQIIEAILTSAKTNQPVTLNLEGKQEKPDVSQAMKKPPVNKPKMVNAKPPSH